MRVILPLFLIGCFLIVMFQAFVSDQPSDPQRYASLFVKHIKDNNYGKVVEGFGGNVCRCPAKLGWVSYLIYGSGEEPNLSCLMGRNFETGPAEVKAMKSDTKNYSMLDKPEDYQVTIPITFNTYRPLFLPLDMAYGYDMTAEQFDKFLTDPDFEAWKGLTLRMRPSLAAGTTDQPEAAKILVNRQNEQHEREEHKKEERKKKERRRNKETDKDINLTSDNEKPDQSALEADLLGEAARYNTPKDAAGVKQADGTTLSQAAVEARLPRLKSARLRLHMVRRDPRQPFTVFHFVISDPVLSLANSDGTAETKELVLKNFRPPAPEAGK